MRAVLLLVAALFLAGCTCIVERPLMPREIDWDGKDVQCLMLDKTGMHRLMFYREDNCVTEDDIHLAAFLIYNSEYYASPSFFIRLAHVYKKRSYESARVLFVSLGFAVPDVPTPGSGEPAYMLGRMQEAARIAKELEQGGG